MLLGMKPFLNGPGFPLVANIVIADLLSETKGEIALGPIQMLLMMLPEHNIKLQDGITLNYAIEHRHEPTISNGRIHGFFVGQIDGMGDEEIDDDVYGKFGEMELDDNGPPFEF